MLTLEDYFRNSQQTGFQLSPDGRHISFLAPYKDRMNIYVRPLEGTADGADHGTALETAATRLTSETERSVAGYFWKGNDRIFFVKDDGGDENYHIFSVSIDGTDTEFIGILL